MEVCCFLDTTQKFKIVIEGDLATGELSFSGEQNFNFSVKVDNIEYYACSAIKNIIKALKHSPYSLPPMPDDKPLFSLNENDFRILHEALDKAEYEFSTTHGVMVTDVPDVECTWKLDFSETQRLILDALNTLDKFECRNNPCCSECDD